MPSLKVKVASVLDQASDREVEVAVGGAEEVACGSGQLKERSYEGRGGQNRPVVGVRWDRLGSRRSRISECGDPLGSVRRRA